MIYDHEMDLERQKRKGLAFAEKLVDEKRFDEAQYVMALVELMASGAKAGRPRSWRNWMYMYREEYGIEEDDSLLADLSGSVKRV